MEQRSRAVSPHPDRGQAAILVVLVATALVAVVMSGLATFGLLVHDRTRARSAADAAALAALGGGRAAASAVAAANGAALTSWTAAAGEVTVMVRIGSQTATARASDSIEPAADAPSLTGP